MNELDRVYRIWVQITLSLAVMSLIAVGAVFFNRVASLTSDSRQLHESVLIETLKKDLPRIAEELYLNLDTLEARRATLQNLVPGTEEVLLKFERISGPLARNSGLRDTTLVKDSSDETTATVAINFEDVPLGNLVLTLRFHETSIFSEIVQTNLLVVIFGFFVLWGLALWFIKKRVLVPLGMALAQEYKTRATAQIAQQVAHDIRSPLTALNMLADRSSELRDDHRQLARMAIQRINDIANALKAQSIAVPMVSTELISVDTCSTTDVNNSIANLIREKLMEIGSRDITINVDPGDNAFGIFVGFERASFERVLSNIINNSIEAISSHGIIEIRIYSSGGFGCIEINDNGCGVPQRVLKNIGTRGYSFGKSDRRESGMGLGLSHAIDSIRQVGGDLVFKSTLGIGSSVLIQIPMAETPKILHRQLEIEDNSAIVIVDDDLSVHEVWRQRLKQDLDSKFIKLIFCIDADELIETCKRVNVQETLFLIDFDLSSGGPSGLSLISRLGISNRSILVTSRSDQPQIELACDKAGVKLLPKTWISTVPITCVTRLA